jgi:hypothetical protein
VADPDGNIVEVSQGFVDERDLPPQAPAKTPAKKRRVKAAR